MGQIVFSTCSPLSGSKNCDPDACLKGEPEPLNATTPESSQENLERENIHHELSLKQVFKGYLVGKLMKLDESFKKEISPSPSR